MIVQPPKTIEDFEAIKETIIALMINPHTDKAMLLGLNTKLVNTINKIKELKTKK